MMKKKVSIIMGIYNCAETLEESIESILNQSYKNWELIMCDDSSIDKTYEIAKRYSELYPEKIKLLKNHKNLTLGPTLNRCLEISTGEYIARQDADDKSVFNRLERQVEFLNNNLEYILVGTKMISFNENNINGMRGVKNSIPTKLDMLTGTAFCHATIMARREMYEVLKGYRIEKYTHRCEDLDLWFRFFEKGYLGFNLEEALYMVRDDGSEYKRRKFRGYINEILTRLDGYRRNRIQLIKYIYLIKPIITYIVPVNLKKKYHIFKIKK